MSRRTNRYKIGLIQISSAKEGENLHPEIQFEFENHDEIFHIIELVKSKKLFEEDAEAIEFTLGLKLFSEIVIENQDKKLFKDFMPALASFMKALKA